MAGGILGTKLGMTQIFNESGECIPVTVIQVGPCTTIQKKIESRDGYAAVQIGYGEIGDKHLNGPMRGHFKAHNVSPKRYLREFRIAAEDRVEAGQQLDVGLFRTGDIVDVSGTSKGKGFQGVIKRHGHKGGPGAHGSHFHRAPGSIGQNTSPAEVAKGTKLPGRMGGRVVTVRNLEVVGIRSDERNLLLRGSVPGPNGGLVFVRLAKDAFEKRLQDLQPAESKPESSKPDAAASEETAGDTGDK